MQRRPSAQLMCGAAAGPLFVTAFTVIGAGRRGYDWRRYPVSSLAIGPHGWHQRANFVLTGILYLCAAAGVRRSDPRRIGPSVVPTLVAGAGIGLVGSGVFVTDYAGDRPMRRSRAGQLHDVFGIPVFAGIPVAGLASAVTGVQSGHYRWACYSASSSMAMVGSLVLFVAGISGRSRLRGRSGVLQRVSIATGLGWLSALSLRGLSR